jgi:hypothetical protein
VHDDVVVDDVDLRRARRPRGGACEQATSGSGDGDACHPDGRGGRDYVRYCEAAFHTITLPVIII